jgi:hypothetical protein
MLHAISAGVMVILFAGLYFRRKRPALHWKLMVTAFTIDLALLLYIEFTRQAIEGLPHASPLLWFHVSVSVAALICYLIMFVLGSRLLRGRAGVRIAHRNTGITFMTLRSLNFVTSFMV